MVVRGNAHDFRVFGGRGDDTAVWHVGDNAQTTAWLGPNLFGGGGGCALWDDDGTDRLVLDIDPGRRLVAAPPTPPGGLLAMAADGDRPAWDHPTRRDRYARYCVECGTGPGGRRTMVLEYVAPDATVRTGYFYLTAFEELQLGVGDEARLFRIDDVRGALAPAPDLTVFRPPVPPEALCE